MELFLTIEAQNAKETGLAEICFQVNKQLSFITDKNLGLQDENNYGQEFRLISIIPFCVDDGYLDALGWKERKQIWRKKREADIRLRMDYKRFIRETPENKKLMFIERIISSLKVVIEKANDDFAGERLIKDILMALQVSQEQLDNMFF